jgi:hypothetical protein
MAHVGVLEEEYLGVSAFYWATFCMEGLRRDDRIYRIQSHYQTYDGPHHAME